MHRTKGEHRTRDPSGATFIRRAIRVLRFMLPHNELHAVGIDERSTSK